MCTAVALLRVTRAARTQKSANWYKKMWGPTKCCAVVFEWSDGKGSQKGVLGLFQLDLFAAVRENVRRDEVKK